jgi:hypothetical protein
VQRLLGLADVEVGGLQHGQEQAVLVLEVVVDEPLVDPRALGDALHARAAQAMLGKLVARGVQDGLLGAVGVARAGQFERRGGRSGGLAHGRHVNRMVN